MKKVDMPDRSTTSSTTGNNRPTSPAELQSNAPPVSEFETLTPSEQESLLELLLRGASPLAACQQLGVYWERFRRTFAEQSDFRERCIAVQQALSQNVAAALYRAAMEGHVSAQNFYLKTNPPPEWLFAAERNSASDNSLSDLTDDELDHLLACYAKSEPPRTAERMGDAPGSALAS